MTKNTHIKSNFKHGQGRRPKNSHCQFNACVPQSPKNVDIRKATRFLEWFSSSAPPLLSWSPPVWSSAKSIDLIQGAKSNWMHPECANLNARQFKHFKNVQIRMQENFKMSKIRKSESTTIFRHCWLMLTFLLVPFPLVSFLCEWSIISWELGLLGFIGGGNPTDVDSMPPFRSDGGSPFLVFLWCFLSFFEQVDVLKFTFVTFDLYIWIWGFTFLSRFNRIFVFIV